VEYARRTPTTPTCGCCSACVDLVFAKFWVAVSLSPLSLSLDADGGSVGISYLRTHAHERMRERVRVRAFSLARYRASRNALTLEQVKVKQIFGLSSSFHCSRLQSAMRRLALFEALSTPPECCGIIELDLDRAAESSRILSRLNPKRENKLRLYA